MFQDFRDLLSAFHAHGVEYLVVGGYAVSYHAQPRATKDLDLLLRPSPENARAVHAALADFGAPLAGLEPSDFCDVGKFIRFGREPYAIDLLAQIDGVNFDEAWARRVKVTLDAETGQSAFFISRSDLIAAKLAAGRTRDLADVEELREAQSDED